MYVWSMLEPCIGIMCICIPLLHPYFKRHSPEDIVGANRPVYGVPHHTAAVYKDPGALFMYQAGGSGYYSEEIVID
jgi:hypothetical protein